MWRLPTNHVNHHLLLHVALVFPTFVWLGMFLTEFALISRSLFRYCGARGKFWTLKKQCLFYTQIDSVRECESTQASHLLVIFENFENYLGLTWEYLEQNWIFFEQIWRFCRAAVKARATKWRRGILYNNLNNIYRQVVGMHSIYLVVVEFWGCFKGKFWLSIVLLFH